VCLTCGCGEPADETGVAVETDTLLVEERLLAKNDRLAEHVRASLEARDITALNLMSSPGSGKTSLLERTVAELRGRRTVCVVEGDQETSFDAERIRSAGARAVQVNTGAGCHLDAEMVHRALHELDPPTGSLLFVENVGNLVCPALFDLGERAKIVVMSVTEGEDKPLKYPHVFRAAEALVLTKLDLLPYVDLDPRKLVEHARRIRPGLQVFPIAARKGEGLAEWCAWLRAHVEAA